MTSQQPLELILARSLMSSLSTPGYLMDVRGVLIFYNEAAEELIGTHFEETGPMERDQWESLFAPTDAAGNLIAFDEHPLNLMVREGRPGHYSQFIRSAGGTRHEVALSALPLLGSGGFKGAMVFFWPVGDGDTAERAE